MAKLDNSDLKDCDTDDNEVCADTDSALQRSDNCRSLDVLIVTPANDLELNGKVRSVAKTAVRMLNEILDISSIDLTLEFRVYSRRLFLQTKIGKRKSALNL